MLIDTIFARDMYQVYEINDDWFEVVSSINESAYVYVLRDYLDIIYYLTVTRI